MQPRLMLDTGPAQSFVLHESTAFERVFDHARRGFVIGVGYPTLAELRGGFEASKSRDRNLQSLRAAFQWIRRWPFTLNAVRIYGEIFSQLRRIGRPIGQVDMQIAAIAMDLGNTIVATYDNDLCAIPGLTVENWLRA